MRQGNSTGGYHGPQVTFTAILVCVSALCNQSEVRRIKFGRHADLRKMEQIMDALRYRNSRSYRGRCLRLLNNYIRETSSAEERSTGKSARSRDFIIFRATAVGEAGGEGRVDGVL